MKVDIILISYNQELYISRALESIFFQQIRNDIQVRVIIADDFSSDRTLEMIKFHETKSPFKFTYLHNEQNLGHVKNYQKAFSICDASYVAILEGDDWWCDPLHIQNHLDFLEIHRECVLSSKRPIWYYEDQKCFLPTTSLTQSDYRYVTVEEEIITNQIVNLSSCVIRGDAIQNLDPRIFNSSVLDWPMYVNLSQMGLLCILSGTSNVYRAKSSGLYAGLNHDEEIEVDKKLIAEIECIFPQYYDAYNKARLALYPKKKSRNRRLIESLLFPFAKIGITYRKIKKIYKELVQ